MNRIPLRQPGQRPRTRPTPNQLRYLRDLTFRAGVEMPIVITYGEARDAIARLERRLQPTLGEL